VSIDLYQIRLYWSGSRGGARRGSARLDLLSAPGIWDDEQEIDYAPEAGVALARRGNGPMVEMTHEERRAVDRWLEDNL
jgi:hypothetical protein